jgi:hypothetical protein
MGYGLCSQFLVLRFSVLVLSSAVLRFSVLRFSVLVLSSAVLRFSVLRLLLHDTMDT